VIAVTLILAGLGQIPGAAPEALVSPFTQPADADRNRLSGRELQLAVDEALRRWSRPAAGELQPAARELLDIYGHLQADRKLASSVRQSLQGRVRARLADLGRRLAAQLSGPRRPTGTQTPAASRNAVLAQLQPGGAQGRGLQQPLATSLNDDGERLVELIRNTIAPQSWDTRGGPGAIMLWPPARALVVRQTDEVHNELADLIDQLRRAGP